MKIKIQNICNFTNSECTHKPEMSFGECQNIEGVIEKAVVFKDDTGKHLSHQRDIFTDAYPNFKNALYR